MSEPIEWREIEGMPGYVEAEVRRKRTRYRATIRPCDGTTFRRRDGHTVGLCELHNGDAGPYVLHPPTWEPNIDEAKRAAEQWLREKQ